MKIEEVDLPILAGYYFSERILGMIVAAIKNAEKIEMENDCKIHLYVHTNPEIAECLRVLRTKSNNSTLKENTAATVEYELDAHKPSGNIFLFRMEDNTINKCVLYHGTQMENDTIHAVFRIIK